MNYANCSSYFHWHPSITNTSTPESYAVSNNSKMMSAPPLPPTTGALFTQPALFPTSATTMSNNNVGTMSSSSSSNNSTHGIHPTMFASVEFWASFVQKYEEYRRCLKNMSSGDVVLSKAASTMSTSQQQGTQGPNSNNNSLNLSSISPSNTSINSFSSSVSPPSHHHHHHRHHHNPYHQPTAHMMTSMMNNYSSKPTSPVINSSNSTSSSPPVLTIDLNQQQECASSSSPSSSPPHHTTCSNCSHMRHNKPTVNENNKYTPPNYHLPFDDSFSSSSTDAMTFKDRQKRFNRFVKKRFIDEFGPIEYLSYKMLKRHESSMMDRIKHEARERYLPSDVTEVEFKVYWKSALNTIRQTRYRYRSRQQYRF